MPERRSVPAFIVLLFATGCIQRQASPISVAEEGGGQDRVRPLFDSMRNGTYTTPQFPALTWDDVSALFGLADSRRMLASFPHNPISSQSQSTCSEGMVALWLVEGVRKGGQFASLNPLCFGNEAAEEAWTTASERNHDRVLAAYRVWWTKVNGFSSDRAAAIDPLEGTGLHWY